MHCEPHTPILCKPGQTCRGNSSLGHQPMLSQTWACQQPVKLSTFRMLVLLRIPVCLGSFLLTAVGVPAQQHPSAATGSLLVQTRCTKCSVNGNAEQAAGSTQAGLQTHSNSQSEVYQMFQPHKEATRMSYCRNCVLPPAMLLSCKNAGTCWLFESYFPFLILVVPQVCVVK